MLICPGASRNAPAVSHATDRANDRADACCPTESALECVPMAVTLNKLNARTVDTLTEPGRHSDGGGLYLSITPAGARRWVFLYRWQSKPTEMGLGSAVKGNVSLARARELATEARSLLANGKSPLAEKKAKVPVKTVVTFGEAADAYIEAMSPQWRNAKHRAQWAMTLTRHAAPLRSMDVAEVATEDVLAVLKPVWSKTLRPPSDYAGESRPFWIRQKPRDYDPGKIRRVGADTWP